MTGEIYGTQTENHKDGTDAEEQNGMFYRKNKNAVSKEGIKDNNNCTDYSQREKNVKREKMLPDRFC